MAATTSPERRSPQSVSLGKLCFSRRATEYPARTIESAAMLPAGPPPTTITSNRSFIQIHRMEYRPGRSKSVLESVRPLKHGGMNAGSPACCLFRVEMRMLSIPPTHLNITGSHHAYDEGEPEGIIRGGKPGQ